MHPDIERLTHSFKTAIACITAILFTKLIGYPNDPWIIISVIVVMCAQIYVGSVLQKGYLRLLGTVLGCLTATIALLLFGNSPLAIMLTVAIAVFAFSYIATGTESLSYAGTLGAVTTTIILIGQIPTPQIAAQRFIEITLGILIATCISQFILPIHARTHLRRAQADTLQQLRDFYQITANSSELEQNIIASLQQQQKLAKESAHELFSVTFNAEQVLLILQCEREILRAISFMHYALTSMHPDTEQNQFEHLPALTAFNQNVIASLNTLTSALDTKKVLDLHIHILSLNAIRNEMTESINTAGFLFSAEILNKALAKLAGLFGVVSYEMS